MSNVMENRKRWAEALRSGKYTEYRHGWAPDVGNAASLASQKERAKTASGPACCLMVAYCEGIAEPGPVDSTFNTSLDINPWRYVRAMDAGASFEEIARMVEAEPEVQT